jgi:hypothetical protein
MSQYNINIQKAEVGYTGLLNACKSQAKAPEDGDLLKIFAI